MNQSKYFCDRDSDVTLGEVGSKLPSHPTVTVSRERRK